MFSALSLSMLVLYVKHIVTTNRSLSKTRVKINFKLKLHVYNENLSMGLQTMFEQRVENVEAFYFDS